jgi:hypothetical protein
MDNILTSTKKLAGLGEEYDCFDADIIMYINSVFLVLKQIGIGPAEGFYISDGDAMWEDFIPDNEFLRETVKSYMGDKVRLKFDPPTIAAVLQALKETIQETEWRLNFEAETTIASNE